MPHPRCPAEARWGDTLGERPRTGWGTGPRPQPNPEVGRVLGIPDPFGSTAGPAGQLGLGFGSSRSPPARMAFPGCVSLAFPDAGAAAARSRGAAIAGRREAGGGAPGISRGSEPPALHAVCRGGGDRWLSLGAGRPRQLMVSASRGSSRSPPQTRPGGRETEAGAGPATQPMAKPVRDNHALWGWGRGPWGAVPHPPGAAVQSAVPLLWLLWLGGLSARLHSQSTFLGCRQNPR